MKPPRSALPKPRYVLREPLKGGVAYFFNVPMWARAAGCPISNEPLGVDYAKAVERAETVLLPAFDSWRTGGKSDHVAPPTKTVFGTLDWIFAEYCADRRYTKLSVRQRRNHKTGFRLAIHSRQICRAVPVRSGGDSGHGIFSCLSHNVGLSRAQPSRSITAARDCRHYRICGAR